MNFSLLLLAALSLVFSSVSCSTITVSCKTDLKYVKDNFEGFMQDFLDHSTEIWQCYKDHLKVNNPGYKDCIDRINMTVPVKGCAKLLTKECFRSSANWKSSLNLFADVYCEELKKDAVILGMDDRLPQSTECSIKGGNFNNQTYAPDPWSTKDTITVAFVAMIVIVTIVSVIYVKSRKSLEKQDVSNQSHPYLGPYPAQNQNQYPYPNQYGAPNYQHPQYPPQSPTH